MLYFAIGTYTLLYASISIRSGSVTVVILHMETGKKMMKYTLGAEISPVYTTLCTRFDWGSDLGILSGL